MADVLEPPTASEAAAAEESSALEPSDGAKGGGPAGPAIPDTFDHREFRAVDFINKIFPTKESLVELEPLIRDLQKKIRLVDREILSAVRKQSSSSSRSKQDLKDAQSAVQELFRKIKEIKRKAEQSEVMVQEICRDIKKLDYAKKHLTQAITALRRLSMLVSATDQLQATAEARSYHEAANLLEAVAQLSAHFASFGQVPKVAELRGRYNTIKGSLKSYIFEDFKLLHMPNADNAANPEVLQRLKDACGVVDCMDPHVRDELVNYVCNKEMAVYSQIFTGTGQVAKIEKTERRYAWLIKMLREKEKVWEIFPKAWRVTRIVCMTFCSITKAQLSEILDHQAGSIDVQALLQALHRTLEFEQDLAKRFGGAEEPEEGATEGAYEEQEASPEPPGGGNTTADIAARSDYVGLVSSCFEKHLQCYVDLEEKTLMGHVDDLVQAETWTGEEGHETNKVLSSSIQLFAFVKKSLKRCTGLTKGPTLLSLYRAFQRVLRAYAAKLAARLPKTSGGLTTGKASNGATDWHIKLEKAEEPVVCRIVNTCEYCYETVEALADNVTNSIQKDLAEEVSAEDEQDAFSGVTSDCLSVLVLGVETRLDEALRTMMKKPWDKTESVGDQSDYVNAVTTVLKEAGRSLGSDLSDIHYQFFCEKVASSFMGRYSDAILRCRRVSEMAAQQILLDTQAIRAVLLDLPVVGESTAAAPGSYTKFISADMGRTERLLKVAGAQQEALVQSFVALMPEGTSAEFSSILDLKGLTKAEKQSMMDAFDRERGAAKGGGAGASSAGGAPSAPGTASSGGFATQAVPGGFTSNFTSRMAAAGVTARASAAAGATQFSLQNLRMGASNFMTSARASSGSSATGASDSSAAKGVFSKAKFGGFSLGGFGSRDTHATPQTPNKE